MNGSRITLSFCWWNLHNFAHFEAEKASRSRWPKRTQDFESKRDRILSTLKELFAGGFPDLLAVCEVTRGAATELARLLGTEYEVVVALAAEDDDEFQVAVIYRKGIGFSPDTPLVPAEKVNVSEETRPMIPVRYTWGEQVIRFVACHWTAFDSPKSIATRQRLAEYLRGDIFDFMQANPSGAAPTHHTVVLGDLNEEPTSPVFDQWLEASRDHASARMKPHWRDRNIKRVRLYNASWRYLGEQMAYNGGSTTPGLAGTYYSDEYGWRTYDHLIVSGSLLDVPPPFLDELNTKVGVTTRMRSDKGTPSAFETVEGAGISDHLPIVGSIVLSEGGR